MAKAHFRSHRSPVIRSLAASNTWIIGLLIALVGIVFIVLYNYASYKNVLGVATRAGNLKPNVTGTQSKEDNGTRISNGCFVLKGDLAVLQKCGTGLFRGVQYMCGDGTKVKLGGSTSCKPIISWLSTIASQCKGHTSCDAKSPSGRPTPTGRPSGFPSPFKTPTPTPHNFPTPTFFPTPFPTVGSN